MPTTTLPFNKQSLERIVRGMSRPLTQTRSFFQLLGSWAHQQTQITFRSQGARSGNLPWPPFSPKTLATSLGTWKIRYGTDKNPKRTAAELASYKTKNKLWYVSGPMKGYRNERRYGKNSKLLQASGQFRKSFHIIGVRDKRMIYGTRHSLADKIIGNPSNFRRYRPVLFMMPNDYTVINRMWFKWYDSKIKI